MAERRLTESVVVSCKVISFEGLKPDLILLDFAMPRMNNRSDSDMEEAH
jgi:CheY-like chemotaxis protein